MQWTKPGLACALRPVTYPGGSLPFGLLTLQGYFHICGNMEKAAAIAALGALAQESRLEIFRLLVQAGPAGLPAGRVGEQLGLPSATLSFHLNALRHADLVTFRREGRSLIYAAAYAAMNELLGYLTENCCQGDPADCAPGACDGTALIPPREGTRQ